MQVNCNGFVERRTLIPNVNEGKVTMVEGIKQKIIVQIEGIQSERLLNFIKAYINRLAKPT